MSDFVKVSALSSEDKSKLKEYWTELWGSDFSNALTVDYKPEGRSQEVKASSKKNTK